MGAVERIVVSSGRGAPREYILISGIVFQTQESRVVCW